MRTFTSFVAWVVAVLAGVAAVPLLWVSANVADEDGYVAFSSCLATDDELQASFAEYLADDFVQRGALPARLQEVAASALTATARQTSAEPGFVDAWEQTQRSFHRSALDDGTGPLTVELGPLAEFVTERLGDRVPVSLRVPDGLSVPVASASERDRLALVEQSRTLGLLALLVVVVAGVTSLLSARTRAAGLAGLGLGALLVAGIVRLGTNVAAPSLLDQAQEQNVFARTVQQQLADRASDSMSGWLVWTALAGAAALVAGLLGRAVAGRR